MPIFKELENSDQASPWRGKGGPLHTRTVKHPHPVTRAFIESARAAGYPLNPDYNGRDQEGADFLATGRVLAVEQVAGGGRPRRHLV